MLPVKQRDQIKPLTAYRHYLGEREIANNHGRYDKEAVHYDDFLYLIRQRSRSDVRRHDARLETLHR